MTSQLPAPTMPAPDDFHVLEQRYRLAGTLTTRTALHIGSAGADVLDAANLPVLKDSDGFPLIPGSSLKGVVRSTVEALVRAAAVPERGVWACDPLRQSDPQSDRSDDSADTDGEGHAPQATTAPKGHDDRPGCGWHPAGERALATESLADHCLVCRLFGSFLVASHVRFCDALLNISDDQRRRGRLPLEIRDGVAIDRDLRRAADKRKYLFEVVAPGARFDIEVFIDNPKPALMGLLMMGFDQISAGFTALGGFSSRGLGRVGLSWHSLTSVTAAELLQGSEPTVTSGDELHAEMSRWRHALTELCQGTKGDSHVSQKL